MSFFQAVPGIHKTWVWGWEWWAARKASEGKVKEPDLELKAVQVGQADLKRLEQALTDLTNRVVELESEKGRGGFRWWFFGSDSAPEGLPWSG
jgi:hypothetical protein